LLRLLQNRQCFQAEEVELHQSRALDILHVELGDRHVGARIAVERDQLGERAIANHDAGGVGGRVPGETLQLLGKIEQAANVVVVGVFAPELGHALQRAGERPGIGRVVGDKLRQPVDLAVAHLQHTAGILQHRARLQLTEGDDLGDLVAAVFLLDVADHLAPPRFAEVDVEVGHRHALGIEEAFEQQAELERIEVGDGQRPGDDAARARAAAGTDGDVLRLGPLDEVGDDQEVAGEPHLDDDVELEGQALAVVLGPVVLTLSLSPAFARHSLAREFSDADESRLQPARRLVAEHRRLAVAVAREAGKDRLAAGRRHRAALRHHQRVRDRLRQVGEQVLHDLGRLHPRFRAGARPVLAVDIGRAGDAQHRVVRLSERRVGEAAGIGRDQRQVAGIGEVDQRRLRRGLDRVAAPGQLHVEPVAEQRLQPVGIGRRARGLILGE
jgi:hypothetical protein